jgi:hypothetical protein
MNTGTVINFPTFTGVRCLMMPYVQGYSASVPDAYSPYKSIIDSVFFEKGKIGFLTIDESPVRAGNPHRGDRARYGRALHTEAGQKPGTVTYMWGGNWGGNEEVMLAPDVRILLANNLNESCAVWDVVHEPTSVDGDIGDAADLYPYENATLMKAGEVHDIGILTPHESLPVLQDFDRQFLRIVSSGVHGREAYFTQNPLVRV